MPNFRPSADIDYLGNIAGSPAATVAANAFSGLTAFNGTLSFRDLVAPNGTGASISANTGTATADGNVVVTVTYAYTNTGTRKADSYIIFIKEGGGTAAATDPAFVTNPISGTITFILKPSTTYSFGFSAARKTADGEFATAITTSSNITTIAGNYTGNVNGTGASTVVTNAGNGATAFSGTVNYRNSNAPGGSIAFGTISPVYTSDGNVVVNVPYSYSPGSPAADFLLVYYKEGGGATVSPENPAVSTNPSSGNLNFTLKPSTTYRFGLQQVRRTESGLSGTAITASAADTVLTGGNYTGNIAGSPASVIASNAASGAAVAVNFNSNNDRNALTPTAPTINSDGTAVDHVINTDGSADISFEWNYTVGSPTLANNIDGFIVYARSSTVSTAYTFGTTPAEETTYTVDSSKRAMTFPGVPADRYYSFGVQAYRAVDSDINSTGVLTSSIVKAAGTGETPSYQPSANVAFNGNITGTIAGSPASTVASNAVSGFNAFNGTAKYRTAGAPTNLVVPTGLTVLSNTNATKTIRVSWAAYVQGANQADVIGLFYRRDNKVPTFTDSCIVMNVNINTPAYYDFIGVNPTDAYSYGIAAGRRTENGIEWGLINTTYGSGPFALYGPDLATQLFSAGGNTTSSPLTEYTPNGEQVYRITDTSSAAIGGATVSRVTGLTISTQERWFGEAFVKQELPSSTTNSYFRVIGTATSYADVNFNRSTGAIYAVGGNSYSPIESFSETVIKDGETWYRIGVAVNMSPGITQVNGEIYPTIYSPGLPGGSPDYTGGITIGPMTLRRRTTTSTGYDWTGITADAAANFTGNLNGYSPNAVSTAINTSTASNLLPNSDYNSSITAVKGYNPYGVTLSTIDYASTVTPGVYTLVSNSTKNLVAVQYSPFNGLSPGSDDLIASDIYPFSHDGLNAGLIPVTPGERYCFSMYTHAHRCKTAVGIAYYDVNGQYLTDAISNPILISPGSCRVLSEYTRQFVILTAPANTAGIIPYFRKYNTTTGQSSSYVWFAAPQLERVSSSVSSPGGYMPGPAITTRQLGYTGDLNATWGAPTGTLVGGSPAASVALNANVAYTGTATYRTAGAPTNLVIPTGINVVTNSNATKTIQVSWAAYVQGANQADVIGLFYRKDNKVPTFTDSCILMNVNINTPAYYDFFGVNPTDAYSFGIAAGRRTENGIEWGLINTTYGTSTYSIFGPDVGVKNWGSEGTISPTTDYTPNGEQAYRMTDISTTAIQGGTLANAVGLTISSTERWIAEAFVKQEPVSSPGNANFRIYASDFSYTDLIFNKNTGVVSISYGPQNAETFVEAIDKNGQIWYRVGAITNVSPGLTAVYGTIWPSLYSPGAAGWSPDFAGAITIGPVSLRRTSPASVGYDWTGITADSAANFTAKVGGVSAGTVVAGGSVGGNVITYSEQLNQSNWFPGFTTVPSSINYLDGNTPFWKLAETATNATHYIATEQINTAVNVGEKLTYSIYAAAAERTQIKLFFDIATWGAFNYPQADFDLSTGTVGPAYSLSDYGIVEVGKIGSNKVYRLYITTVEAPSSISANTIRAYASLNYNSTYTGVSGYGMYLTRAQVNKGALSEYIKTGATAISSSGILGDSYTGTRLYRTAGAPTNLPIPTGVIVQTNANATKTIRVTWAAYTQGANQADVLGLFYRRDNNIPTLQDSCIVMNVNLNTPSYYDFVGVNPTDAYSFGIAAGRRTESGIEWGIINTTYNSTSPYSMYSVDELNRTVDTFSQLGTTTVASAYYTPNGERGYTITDDSGNFEAASITVPYSSASAVNWLAEAWVKRDPSATSMGLFRFGIYTASNIYYYDNVIDYTNGAIAPGGTVLGAGLAAGFAFSETYQKPDGEIWYKIGALIGVPATTGSPIINGLLLDTYPTVGISPSFYSAGRTGSAIWGGYTIRRASNSSTGFDWSGITADAAANFTGNLSGFSPNLVIPNLNTSTGTNLLPNSDYGSSMTATNGWNPNGATILEGITYASSVPGWTGSYALTSNTTQNLFIRQGSPVAGGDDQIAIDIYPFSISAGNSAYIPIMGGQNYCFSAYTQAHRCKTSVGLGFYDISGSPLGFPASSVELGSGGLASHLSQYKRQFVIATAPASAAYSILYVRKYNTTVGNTDSYMWFAAPQLERVNPSVSSPGPYMPGPAISTRQLGYTGELNATYGANWDVNVTNIPYATITNNDDAVALGLNPSFEAWPSGNTYPNGWYAWSSTPIKETSTVRVGKNAVRFNCDGVTQYGVTSNFIPFTEPLPVGTFIAGTIDMYMPSIGTTGFPGIYITAAYDATNTEFKINPVMTANTWQKIPFTVRVPTGKRISGIQIWLLAAWTGFASRGGSNLFNGQVIYDNLRLAFFDSTTDNTSIRVSPNGALKNAGGGVVTITGLGYTGALNATYGATYGSNSSTISGLSGDGINRVIQRYSGGFNQTEVDKTGNSANKNILFDGAKGSGIRYFAISSGNGVSGPSTGYYGSKAIQITVSPGSNIRNAFFASTNTTYNMPIDPNAQWILSAKAWVGSPYTSPFTLSLGVRDNTATTYFVSQNITTPQTWVDISGVLDLSASASTSGFLIAQTTAVSTETNVWLDGIMLEKRVGPGTTPTPWVRSSVLGTSAGKGLAPINPSQLTPGTLLPGLYINQGNGVTRPVLNGLYLGYAKDGDVISFSPAYSEVPTVIWLPGANVTTAGLSPASATYETTGLTTTGFTAKLKITATTGTPTTVTESTSATNTTISPVGGGSISADYVINKATAAEAWDDKYTYKYTVSITNTGPDAEGIYEPGEITVVGYARVAAGWTQVFSNTHSGGFSSATTSRTITTTITLDGVIQSPTAGQYEFAIDKVFNANDVGGGITGFTNVTYGTATAPTQVAATQAGSFSVPFIVIANGSGT